MKVEKKVTGWNKIQNAHLTCDLNRKHICLLEWSNQHAVRH